jgi:hypothetical protein
MRLASIALAAAIVSLSVLSVSGTAEARRWHGRHWHHHHHHGGFYGGYGGGAFFGFTSGLLLGGAIASPYYGAPYYYPRPYYYPPPVVYGPPVGYPGYYRPYYRHYEFERGYNDSVGD